MNDLLYDQEDCIPHLKIFIAQEYLYESCSLFLRKKFFSSLHLSGAAEEIFGVIIEQRNEFNLIYQTTSLEKLTTTSKQTTSLELINSLTPTNKHKWSPNRAKNSIKHPKSRDQKRYEPTTEIDIKAEAELMLLRAINNYKTLDFSLEGDIEQVWNILLDPNYDN